LADRQKSLIFVSFTNMKSLMELLLHYVWQHRLYAAHALATPDGTPVEVIDPGLHNSHAGPDFFNAKVRIGGVLWAGNVELHERSSDWYRHGHEADAAYDNVVLHVAAVADRDVHTKSGRTLPQIVLDVPSDIAANYRELLREERFPPCWRVIPKLPALTRHAWLSALTVERLEAKMERIVRYFERTEFNWEWTFFVTLARNFGFGVNSEAFEEWALRVNPAFVGRHRDVPEQVEAYFFGQAGLLDTTLTPPERQDAHFKALCRDYRFLQNKFSLEPMDPKRWKFLRLRPQNFPGIRLSQLVWLYVNWRVSFSRILETEDLAALREMLRANVTPYWERHYTFGHETAPGKRTLRDGSLDLLLINTVAPLLFAYGRKRMDEDLCERAFALLEKVKAERNFITRSWQEAGLQVENAADSQALIQLRRTYCDRKDCLRCRFGAEYLRKRRTKKETT